MKNTVAAIAALAALACPTADAFHSLGMPGHHQRHQQGAVPAARTRNSHTGALEMMHGDLAVNRRAALMLAAALPLLGLRKASAATLTEADEIAKLQAEASRIQEIFDVQKSMNNKIPSLKDGLQVAKAAPPAPADSKVAAVSKAAGVAAVDMKDVVAVIDKMMVSLKQEGEGGMRTVLALSAPNNPVVNMPFQNVINAMRDNEYALLFGKFTSYEIKTPSKSTANEEEGLEYSTVDVVVKAPYKTMLSNGVQFKDMTMGNDMDKTCSVTFRWNMRQERDGMWGSEGCYVLPVQA